MGTDMAVTLARHLLIEALLLCAPMLVAACVVSLVMSLLQTLTAVPRLMVVFLMVVMLMPWLAHRTVSYTIGLWTNLQRYLG